MTSSGNLPKEELDTKTVENSENGQAQQMDYEKQYKELQSEFDRRNEDYYRVQTKIAEANPKEILSMDKKLQNKVIKSIYWYDNLEELKVIHWENFYENEDKASDDGDEDDRTSVLEKELKLIKWQQSKWELNRALDEWTKENKSIISSDEDALTKIRNELEYVSDKLDAKERIKRASAVLYWKNVEAEAYLAMQETSFWNSATGWNTPKENDFASFAKKHGFIK